MTAFGLAESAELRVDLDQGRLVETAAAQSVGAAANGKAGNAVLWKLAFGGPAGGAGIVGDDESDPADALVGLELAQRDGRG
jgi:hypothetical protein